MRKAVLLSLFLLISVTLFLPLVAQDKSVGPNPTTQSVNEEMLFRQDSRIGGRVSIPDANAQILIQPQGRDWRELHEVWLPWIGGIVIALMVLGILAFYLLVGPTRSLERPTGTKIVRFKPVERFTHWLVAVSFIILALSGLNYIFGKRVIEPLVDPLVFGQISQWAKYAHNFFAWPFVIGVALMFVFWVRDNMFRRTDWSWFRAGGGLVRHQSEIHAGRFNGGQKLMFWSVVIGSLLMFASGLVLLFPLRWVDVNGMQLTGIIHGFIGVLFIAGILAHIYIGTIGMQGAFEAMGSGTVDLGWARQHHDQWAEEVAGPRRDARPSAPTRERDLL
jgi:formate dehydrogenase subunit gamma